MSGLARPVPKRTVVGFGLVAGIFTWSLASVIPGVGLDDSWRAGLYLALERNLHFGSQVDFTYGPLGFLTEPYVFNPALGLTAWLVTSTLHLLLCVTIALMAARHADRLVASWLFVMGAIASLYIEPLIAATCVMVVLVFVRARRPRKRRRLDDVACVLAGAVAAVGLLVKPSDGLVTFAMGVAICVTAAAWVRGLMVFAAACAASLAALWLVSAQRLSDFAGWVRASAEFVLGYSSAMGRPGIERHPDLSEPLVDSVTILAGLIALLLVYREARSWRARHAFVALAAFGFFVFQGYKDGTVRHAPMQLLASLFVVVAWMVPWDRLRGVVRPVGLAVAALALLAALRFDPATLRPVERIAAGISQVRTLVAAQPKSDAIAPAQAHLRDEFAVSPAILARIGSRPVHVAPYDTSVIWAYPGLTWSPLPVFQAYAAYTAYLDGLDAAALTSGDGPEFILRRPNATIDGRSEWYEAPRSMLALACNYDEVMTDGRWQLLEKRVNRCAAAQHLGTVRIRPGDLLTLPAPPSADGVVIARIHGLSTDPVERIRTFIASSLIWTVTLSDGTFYRLVPTTADGPLIIALRSDAIYSAPNGPPTTTSLVVTAGNDVAAQLDDQPDIELMIDLEFVRVSD